MHKCTLELVDTYTPQEVRDERMVGKKSYTGSFLVGPTINTSFKLYRDDGLIMYTSAVKTIMLKEPKEVKFRTRNSTYKLTIGEAFDD